MYDRVLNEGEILQIHNQGGLQVDKTLVYPTYKTVDITDLSIVSYLPFISPGFIDASRHHLNMFANQDEGVLGGYLICPGPFGRAMPFNDTTSSVDIAIATPSGTITELLYGGNGSFTIAAWFCMDNTAGVASATYDNTTLISLGSIGSTFEFATGRAPSAFVVSASGAANNVRLSARFFEDGIVSLDKVQVMMNPEVDLSLSVMRHVAVVYDEQTKGVALYTDGMLSQSGTLPKSLYPVMQQIVGSGYPLVFLNGIPSTTTDVYSNLGGDDCAVSEILIANRPFLPSEVRYIAESGIDISPTFYSVHDPRLRGYWDCTGSGTNDHIIQDSCMIFTSGGIPGHLTQVASDTMWSLIATSVGRKQLSSLDRFSRSRNPLEGITSGTWAVMSTSDGIGHATNATGEFSRTSSSDLCQRYRMFADERDLRAPSHINEYIIGFNVTPSGTIPRSFGSTDREVNSMLFTYGEPSASDQIISYLTNALAPASGVMLVYQTTDGTGTVQNPLVSGQVSYGVRNRVMFHAKPLLPYNNDTVTPIEITLYINNVIAQRAVYANTAVSGPAARLYDSDTAQGTSDNWTLQIGGRATQDVFSTLSTTMDGLSGIMMNAIFVMVGSFSANDILRLAASGINSSKTISNFSNTLPMAPITIQDQTLEGYWRFSGPDSGSGILDLSSKGNDLNPVARSLGAGLGAGAFALRYIPLGFVNAAMPRQASGITYNGFTFTGASASPPAFAISGSRFQIPQSGFSVGFWMAPISPVNSDKEGLKILRNFIRLANPN
jgi:hypothetical protein